MSEEDDSLIPSLKNVRRKTGGLFNPAAKNSLRGALESRDTWRQAYKELKHFYHDFQKLLREVSKY